MRISCTGGGGKVGTYLKRLGVADLKSDITNVFQLEEAIKLHKPQVIIHLACISDVDYCEDRANSKKVADVNIRGTYNVADIARRYGVGVVLLSSDHVFNGKKLFGRYKETDTPKPINAYGISKFAAEGLQEEFTNLKVIRTSRLFDNDCLKLSMDGHPTFIERSYMYLGHFSNSLVMYANRFYSMPSILHISGSKSISEYEFMLSLAEVCGYDTGSILPRKKENKEFAPRPKHGGLDVSRSKMLGLPQYDYYEGLVQMRRDIQK